MMNSTALKRQAPDGGMRAVAINRFGAPETLTVRTVPLPEPEPNQILIRVESAGVGIWDIAELAGSHRPDVGIKPKFPWILGSEGAGKVVAVGEKVSGFKNGDLVYGLDWGTNPKARVLRRIHGAGCGVGLADSLNSDYRANRRPDNRRCDRHCEDSMRSSGLKPGEKLMVFGASGGIGHLAVQLASRMGAHVFAIASGEDGVALARRLGAEGAVEGHDGDIVASGSRVAPNGFDAALVTAGGEAADRALTTIREGGRVAYPNGLQPVPKAPSTVRLLGYNDGGYWKKLDHGLIGKLNKLIEAGPFEVHLGKTFSLDQVVDAHRALTSHYLGRLALLPARQSSDNGSTDLQNGRR